MLDINIYSQYVVKYRNKICHPDYSDVFADFISETVRWRRVECGGMLLGIISDLMKDRYVSEIRFVDPNEMFVELFNPDNGSTESIWIRWEEKPEKKSIAVWA